MLDYRRCFCGKFCFSRLVRHVFVHERYITLKWQTSDMFDLIDAGTDIATY